MKKNVWLLRPMPHGSDHLQEFLAEDIIAVGYPTKQDFTSYNYEEIREALDEYGWGEGIGNINILVHSMKIGDIVLVPDSNKKDVYFCRVISNYLYVPELDDNKEGTGYPHQRKVEWLFEGKAYLRTDLPDGLRSSLRYPGAVADLTKHYDLVEQILSGNNLQGLSELEDTAWRVIEELLQSTDDEIRLKAAEIILIRK